MSKNTARKTNVKNTLCEQTIKVVNAIDNRIVTLLNEFIPLGSDSEEKSSQSPCYWHFSEFYGHVVGMSAVVSWLQSYVEFHQELSTILEDYAYFCAVLNDYSLTIKLGQGILLYIDKLLGEKEGQKKVVPLEVLKNTGWMESLYDASVTDEARIDVCKEILLRRRLDLLKIFVSENISCRDKELRKPLNAIISALLAPFFLDKNSLIGKFFLLFFADILPLPVLFEYNDSLKRMLRKVYCTQVAIDVIRHFVTLARLRGISDEAERTKLSQKLTDFSDARTRSSITDETRHVSLVVDTIRFSFFRYVNNFLYYSNKMSVLIHVTHSSLVFLNIFRLHMYFVKNAALSVFASTHFENLLAKTIGGARTKTDPAIICAPYCFNCGRFVDAVWPNNHVQLEHTQCVVKGDHTYVCTCNMARYCSNRCAQLHYSTHRKICCGTPITTNSQTNDMNKLQVELTGTTIDGVD